MDKQDLQILIGYNAWANRRILEAAARVTAEQFTAPVHLSFGSLRGTLVHILMAETIWRQRCQDAVSPSSLLVESQFPTFDALRQAWEAEMSALEAYVASLGDADMPRLVHYTNTKRLPFETILWQILAHVVNHGTQFRSEAGVVLSEYGCSPGDVDLIKYLREVI
jgi:uncharacterized damage-inducible protein DinB